MENSELVKVPSLQNVYVSKDGRAFFKRKEKTLEFSYMKDKDGYIRIGTSKNGKPFRVSLHRCICEAFLGEDKRAVNHIDFNRTNNSLENLEYLTNKENTHHSFKKGRIFQGNQIADDCIVLAILTVSPHKRIEPFAGLSLPAIRAIEYGRHFSNMKKSFGEESTFYQKNRAAKLDRNKRIVILRSQGLTFTKIGSIEGMTKTRASQIYKENIQKWI